MSQHSTLKTPCAMKHLLNFTQDVKLLPLQGVLLSHKTKTQGGALGIMAIGKASCKGKSFIYCQEF